MRVFVNHDQVSLVTIRAETEFKAMPRMILDTLRYAASEEVDAHEYQNQTGDLEGSTYAEPISTSDSDVIIEFGARMEYASYVEARGLSHVSRLAEHSDEYIQQQFEVMAKTIVGA